MSHTLWIIKLGLKVAYIKGLLDIGYQVKVHYGCYTYYLLVLETEDAALLTSEVVVFYNCLINISQARDFFSNIRKQCMTKVGLPYQNLEL